MWLTCFACRFRRQRTSDVNDDRVTFTIVSVPLMAATRRGMPSLLNIRGTLVATDRRTAAILVTAMDAMIRSLSYCPVRMDSAGFGIHHISLAYRGVYPVQ